MDGVASGWPVQPVIYEINTAVWLDSLSQPESGTSARVTRRPAAWDSESSQTAVLTS